MEIEPVQSDPRLVNALKDGARFLSDVHCNYVTCMSTPASRDRSNPDCMCDRPGCLICSRKCNYLVCRDCGSIFGRTFRRGFPLYSCPNCTGRVGSMWF